MRKFSLDALARKHTAAAATAGNHRSAETVVGGHEHVMRQTLISLTAGSELSEHDNPGEATLLVVAGRVRLTCGDESWEGRHLDLIDIPPNRHSLAALEDSTVLLSTAIAR